LIREQRRSLGTDASVDAVLSLEAQGQAENQ
jgi:hypothetical protein